MNIELKLRVWHRLVQAVIALLTAVALLLGPQHATAHASPGPFGPSAPAIDPSPQPSPSGTTSSPTRFRSVATKATPKPAAVLILAIPLAISAVGTVIGAGVAVSKLVNPTPKPCKAPWGSSKPRC